MRPTNKAKTTSLLVLLLAAIGSLLSYPTLIIGAALICGWLLARQIIAVEQFQTAHARTTVTVSPAVDTTQIDTDVPVTVRVQRPEAAAETHLTVTTQVPAAAEAIDEDERTITLHSGETDVSITILTSIPTAGRMTFPEPQWQVQDAHGQFTEFFTKGPSPTLVVEAPRSDDIHVGRGGSELAAYGRHPTDQTGEGITPAELREYTGSEPADRIDWKATARLPDTYTRQFEAESDLEISLLIDHRTQKSVESQTDTPLRYLRAVALGIIETAESNGDPIGLITAGNEGLTTIVSPTRQQDRIAEIKERVYSLNPTPTGPPNSTVDLRHPESVRRLSEQLSNDDSAFGSTLSAFTESTTGYIKQMESDSLYGGVEYLNTTTQTTQLRVIFTTDNDRARLRETVRTAATGDNSVLVFITPSVLFNYETLSQIETAYTEYRAFEEFRRELDRFASVSAYEVGPRDRLNTLLSTQQNSHKSTDINE